MLGTLLGQTLEAHMLLAGQLLMSQLEDTAGWVEALGPELKLTSATPEVIGAIKDDALELRMPRRAIAPQTRLTLLYVPTVLFM